MLIDNAPLRLARFFFLGDFDIFVATCLVTVLGCVIYTVINCFSFRDLLRRFGFLKTARRDFYECGFRPVEQKAIRLPLPFLLICIFFLLYDIELIFFFPFLSGIAFCAWYDLLIFFGLVLPCLISLLFDFNRHALHWQY